MKIPLLVLIHSLSKNHGLSMSKFYSFYKLTRQGYHQGLKLLNNEIKMMKEIENLVLNYRKNCDRRAGSRSLYYNLTIKKKFSIGVTKFENLMSKYGLTLLPLRIKVVTTQSSLQSWNYNNLCNGLIVNGINQLIVGDITYVNIGRLRYYLFCLTDVYSLKVVGHKISKRMRAIEAMAALKMCLKIRGKKNLSNCIHHTDGGMQYFSKLYIEESKRLKLQTSVAKSCLENGYAEQKNGFIKNHLIPTMKLNSEYRIDSEIRKLIMFYNDKRKQKALGWNTPTEFELKNENRMLNKQMVLHDHEKNISGKN